MKTDMEREKQAEEKMYADLWYADMQAKAKREEMETQQQMSANRETLQILNKQMAALEAQKKEEKRLQDEEARLLVSTKISYINPIYKRFKGFADSPKVFYAVYKRFA